MKRRTSTALPALYAQVRWAATAVKRSPIPLTEWDNVDSNVAPPAPNLSKWAAPPPKPQESSPPSPPSSSSSRPPRNQWSRPENSSPVGKWARADAPHTQLDRPQPSSTPLFSRGRNDAPALGGSPIGRWARQDAPLARQPLPQGPSRTHHESRLQRDEAPHKIGNSSSKQNSMNTDRRDKLRGDLARDLKGLGARAGQTYSRGHDRPAASKISQEDIRSQNQALPTAEADSVKDLSDRYADPDAVPSTNGLTPDRTGKFSKDKASFKTRGSITAQLERGASIPAHPRVHDLKGKLGSKGADRRKKMKTVRKVNPDVFIPSTVSVGQLARLLNVRMERLQRKMVEADMAEESAYDYVLTSEYAALLAEEFNRNPIINDEAAFDIYPRPANADPSSLPSRPPIVTIMGHVDHGKTTLLDTLRSASVAKGEAGGITQHIGAFSVPVPGGSGTITFLDTPGHAAFSAMRARGAGVTDTVVLVVAADDGVMPQTKEVIELTKKDEGKVGVVVAINKVDKDGVNVDNVTQALMVEGIQLESYGGDTPGVEVSGLTGHGLENLVETLSAMAEMQDLRAEREGQVQGYVLESKVHKGLGPVATVLILRGCLSNSSHLISGTCQAKVRIMHDSAGVIVKDAYPGMAVTVSGWKVLPNAGDEVLSGSEADVKKALANRQRKAEIESTLIDMEAINSQRIQERRKEADEDEDNEVIEAAGPKELRLVIKGDVSGSVEAVVGSLQDIGNKEAVVKIVSSGVGDVSESDVMMAKAAEGMVVAFSVNIPRAVEGIAASNSVPLYSSAIIYRVMEEIRSRVTALLPPIIEKKVTGEANVQQIFDIHVKSRQTKQVAGCRVINGLVEKARHGRVVRDGATIHEGPLETLKQAKRDMTEVRKGMECGLSFTKFHDLKEGDLIQMYQDIEKPGIL